MQATIDLQQGLIAPGFEDREKNQKLSPTNQLAKSSPIGLEIRSALPIKINLQKI
jgi:hypothetical protein